MPNKEGVVLGFLFTLASLFFSPKTSVLEKKDTPLVKQKRSLSSSPDKKMSDEEKLLSFEKKLEESKSSSLAFPPNKATALRVNQASQDIHKLYEKGKGFVSPKLILKEVEEVRSAVAQFARVGEAEETLPKLRQTRQRASKRLQTLKDIRNSLTPLQRKPLLSPRQIQKRQAKLEVILQDIETSRRPAHIRKLQENKEECKRVFIEAPEV